MNSYWFGLALLASGFSNISKHGRGAPHFKPKSKGWLLTPHRSSQWHLREQVVNYGEMSIFEGRAFSVTEPAKTLSPVQWFAFNVRQALSSSVTFLDTAHWLKWRWRRMIWKMHHCNVTTAASCFLLAWWWTCWSQSATLHPEADLWQPFAQVATVFESSFYPEVAALLTTAAVPTMVSALLFLAAGGAVSRISWRLYPFPPMPCFLPAVVWFPLGPVSQKLEWRQNRLAS